MQVLRVQDEAALADGLQRGLTAAGFVATVEDRSNGQTGAVIVVYLPLAPGGVTHLEMGRRKSHRPAGVVA